jgi:hypothetical protein
MKGLFGFLWASAFALLLTCIPASISPAQSRKLNINEDTLVVLKFAPSFFNFQKVSGFSGRPSYVTYVNEGADGKTLVNGRDDWRQVDWPFMQEMTLAKIDRQKDYVEAELRTDARNYKVRFDASVTDINRAFADVAYQGTLSGFKSSDYFKTEVSARLLPRMFSDKLAVIADDERISLLNQLGYFMNAVGGETVQKKFFIVYTIRDDEYYNLDETHRTVVRGGLLRWLLSTAVKESDWLRKYKEFDGIKCNLRIDYKRSASAYQWEYLDETLSIYVPFTLIDHYKEANLPAQRLADRSSPAIDGARLSIQLPASSDGKYFLGSKGGCYSVNPAGRKVYVDASMCD